MLRPFALLLALALAACSDRDIEEEPPSRRHLAAEWCADWCTFWYACNPILAVNDCRESCESDEAWDRTDECGDLMWAYRECLDSLSCEEARGDPEVRGDTPACQAHYNAYVARGCTHD